MTIIYPELMDYEFFLRLGLQGYEFHLINDFLGCFRLHGESKTTQLRSEWETDMRLIEEKHGIQHRAAWIQRAMSRLYRTYHYLRQGQFSYAYRVVLRRLSSLCSSDLS